MARIAVTTPVDPAALKATLGVDVFTSRGDDPDATSLDVIADVDEATLQAAIDGYTPPADPEDEFRQAVTAAIANEPAGSPLRKLADALLGTSGPGAEPRRPDRAPA